MIMEYKGYLGSVEFSQTDGVFYGQVQGIQALISYEGQNEEELAQDFCGAVDDYLSLCAAKGKIPEQGSSYQNVPIVQCQDGMKERILEPEAAY